MHLELLRSVQGIIVLGQVRFEGAVFCVEVGVWFYTV